MPYCNLVKRTVLTLLAVATINGCTQTETESPLPGRWYSQAQIERGRSIFQANCAHCHGENAQGTGDWRKADENGHYPPPPLNGSAHAWHHSTKTLAKVIAKGGAPMGGTMPGFETKLTADEIHDVIAYFQSFWPDDIYARWNQFDKR